MKFKKDKDLQYVDTGKGKTILFFHGLSAGPESYVKAVTALEKDFRIIAPILTSFKRYEVVNKRIAVLLGKLKIDKVAVIGHSSGGIHAINFAKDYPDKTAALIMIDTAGIYSEKSLFTLQWKWIKFVTLLLLRHPRAFLIGAKDFFRTVFSTKEIISEVNFARKYSLEKLFLKVPVLILWGRKDNLIPLSSAHKLNEAIAGSKLEIVDGDHSWLIINTDLFARKINEFLK